MTTHWGVRSLSVGTFEEPGPAVFWMRRWDEWISLRLQLILIEGYGRTILVNTALPDDLGQLRAEYPGAIMWGEAGTRGAIVRTPEELQVAARAPGSTGARPNSSTNSTACRATRWRKANSPDGRERERSHAPGLPAPQGAGRPVSS